MVKQLFIRLARIHAMMALHVPQMDIEVERNGKAVLKANLNLHELSSSKQSV